MNKQTTRGKQPTTVTKNGIQKDNRSNTYRVRKMINGKKYDCSFSRKKDAVAYLKLLINS